MNRFFLLTLLLVFILIYSLSFLPDYRIILYSSPMVYRSNSLCTSLLNNVLYHADGEICNLPCNLQNNYRLITKADNEDCKKMKPAIEIEGNKIKALTRAEVSQYLRNQNKVTIDIVKLNKGESIDVKSEVIRTVTNFTNNEYDWFLKFIPKQMDRQQSNEKLSVHLIMFDAASRYVAKTQLLNTVKTLKSLLNQYTTYDMLRYHTIGANSNPHFPPLFYGVNETEAKSINKVILEDFKEEGYITINAHEFIDPAEKLYGENIYNGSDHNINYISADPKYMNVGGEGQYGHHPRCVGHQQIHKYVFEYLKESIKYYHDKNQPTLSLTILSDSHDYKLLSLPRIDKDLSEYIKYLHKENILNNSVLFFFSDHGLHYGPYHKTKFGTVDHSLPLMFSMFPKWFTQKYSNIDKNMRINQNRFVTAFDFHSTLFDIAHFEKKMRNTQNKRGISLFKPIPKNRNCHEFHVVYGCSCRMKDKSLNIP